MKARDFSWLHLAHVAIDEFLEDKAPRLGAALAFYTIFAIAPLIIMSIGVASLFFGADAVQGHVKQEFIGLVGKDGAVGIEAVVSAAEKEPHTGIVSSILGMAALLLGATGAFVELKDAMNTVWEVETRPEASRWSLIRDRLLSFAMVLSVAFLLLVSMVLSALVTAFAHRLPFPKEIAQWTDTLVSLIVITLLFALIFKYLPDARIRWRDVWIGAVGTAVFFTVGKYFIGLYLGRTAIASAYGAAGSFVVFLIWTYYSSQILLLGAEFTKVYAKMSGREIVPLANARLIECKERSELQLAR
jgi:membrane protein